MYKIKENTHVNTVVIVLSNYSRDCKHMVT